MCAHEGEDPQYTPPVHQPRGHMHEYTRGDMRDMQKAMEAAMEFFGHLQAGLEESEADAMVKHMLNLVSAKVAFETLADGTAVVEAK